MKALYWRPQRVSLRVLFVVTFIAYCGFAALEIFRIQERQPHYATKLKAARTALKAFRIIKQARAELGLLVDLEVDPAGSQSPAAGVALDDGACVEDPHVVPGPSW